MLIVMVLTIMILSSIDLFHHKTINSSIPYVCLFVFCATYHFDVKTQQMADRSNTVRGRWEDEKAVGNVLPFSSYYFSYY